MYRYTHAHYMNFIKCKGSKSFTSHYDTNWQDLEILLLLLLLHRERERERERGREGGREGDSQRQAETGRDKVIAVSTTLAVLEGKHFRRAPLKF